MFSDATKAESPLSFVHPGELQEAPENPRQITDERFQALMYALDRDHSMMLARPIIADVGSREVVCGNMRLRAAKQLGWEEVPVYLHKFESQAQRREWMLRDNQEYGEYVPQELAAIVSQHEAEGADMRLLGFDPTTLSDLQKLGDPSADLPEGGDAPSEELPSLWGVVIDCEDEGQQAELLEELSGRGLKVRALL